MRIGVNVVERNQEGLILSEKSVGQQAIIDMTAKTAQFVETNAVDIVALLWDRKARALQIFYQLGAYDSAGCFHCDESCKVAREIWSPERCPGIWAKYDLDNREAISLDDVRQWLFDENVVFFAGQIHWHKPGLEVRLSDDTGKVVADYKRGSETAKVSAE
jgi:hypothetical protein